jgi:hypothetical protein
MRRSYWRRWIFWNGREKGVTERTWLYNDTILPNVMITKSIIIIVYVILLVFHNFIVWFLLSWLIPLWLIVVYMNRYASICRMVQKVVSIVKQMDPKDPFRVDMTDKLLEKLWEFISLLIYYISLAANSITNIAANYYGVVFVAIWY